MVEEALPFDDVLAKAIRAGASDILLQEDRIPVMRRQGQMEPLDSNVVDPENLKRLFQAITPSEKKAAFRTRPSLDFSYVSRYKQRFRVHVSLAQGRLVFVFRAMSAQVPRLESLGLPTVVERIARFERGLVLVCGRSGAGKSTTLAAIAQRILTEKKKYLVTIEDPVEFHLRDSLGYVSQKEVGQDAADFPGALRSVLRENPDVIMIGEMRDKETIETALTAAETGHLVLATVHATDAVECVYRILSTFGAEYQNHIRFQLASILNAIICQRLVPARNGKELLPATEVMINNDRVKFLINHPEQTDEIRATIEDSRITFKMQSFDQSLMELYHSGKVTYETAIGASSRPGDFELRCKGVTEGMSPLNIVPLHGKRIAS